MKKYIYLMIALSIPSHCVDDFHCKETFYNNHLTESDEEKYANRGFIDSLYNIDNHSKDIVQRHAANPNSSKVEKRREERLKENSWYYCLCCLFCCD